MDNKLCVGYLTNIRDMFVIGSEQCEGEALKYQQNFISALNYAIESINNTQGQWIPIKTRKLTEEEKEEYPDSTFMYDCRLPDDGEEVLVTTWAGNVALDSFCRDDGCYFENNCDEDDVIAWMPKPEPYKKEVAEVIGHWKEHYYPHFDVPGIECSICGAVVESWVSYMPKPDTCPNCHSKMEVEK